MSLALLLVLATASPLDEMRTSFAALECERVLELASSIEADTSSSPEDKHEARFRRGYCLVVIGNVAEAGELFQSIFTDDIDAVVPFAIEQRVKYLVDVARSEVKAKRDAEAAEARRKLVERITLHAQPPDELKGGMRAFFHVKLDDPDGVVRSMRVDFRKHGEPEFYALPVKKQSDGTWRGEVPGSYTKSAQGTTLEWFVTASDDKGERLTSFGERDAPKLLPILPGSVVAEDLRASERMGYATRAVAGAVVTPVATVVGMMVGAIAGGVVGVGIDTTLPPSNGVVEQPFGYFLALVSSFAGGAGGAAVVNFTLLDQSDAIWATSVVALVLLIGNVGVGAFQWANSPPGSLGRNFSGGAEVAVISGFIAAVGGAIVTPLFVLNDPPQE